MKKVWINPAFKDQVVVKPEEKVDKKEEKPAAKEKKVAAPKPEKTEARREKKVDNSIIQITEPVIERLKERGTNTDKITDLLNKDFTKDSLKEELKNRAIPTEDINKIVCCIKERKPQYLPPPKREFVQTIEHKLFQYFIDKQIPIEVRLMNGETFTGKIKWYSDWLIAFEIKGKPGTIIVPRLVISFYKQKKENSLSEEEINQLPSVDITGVEIKMMQQYRDNKTPLAFHLQGDLEIKGTLDWYEKLVTHIKSLDGKTEHTLHRGNILYFEEVV